MKLSDSCKSVTQTHPAEKLYLQLDKPYYATGDTIWLKAYLFNAPTLLFSSKSGLLHIDITSDSGKLVKQYLLPVSNGTSWGNISLDSTTFKSGTYILRAYTNWMRNFVEAGFYNKQFYITNPNENSWLINSKVSRSGINDKQTVNAQLQFTDINKLPVANAPIQLKVFADKKNLYSKQLQTDDNGKLAVNFTLPNNSLGLSMVAERSQENHKRVIPLNLGRPEKVDIQFLPEGGSLIVGLPANIGFKAIGEDGRGINIEGIVTDRSGRQKAAFRSLHAGMGSMKMAINAGESYTAKITLPGGAIKEYPLPAVKATGTLLQIKNLLLSDSLEVAVAASDDIVKTGNSFFLIGKARGTICYAAIVDFRAGNYLHKKIAESLLPTGITHFILTNTSGETLNERLVYVDHHDDLKLELTKGQTKFGPKDSISIRIRATDKDGNPAAGNFSLSVTDDGQVVSDTLKQDNMISCVLLSSELKGYIEDPGYYMQSGNVQSRQALDNLLLTQGWVNYDWPTGKKQADFQAETEFAVKGQVTSGFGKALSGTHVALLSKSPVIIKDTVTSKDGRFAFTTFPRIDAAAFILRAVNKNNRSFNVGIKMDEESTPVTKVIYPYPVPWYINSDSTIINYIKNMDSLNKQRDYYYVNGHRLKEVKILAKKTIKGSQNLNGPGEADVVLDEKDMEQAGKKSWLQLLSEKIKGFREGTIVNPITHVPIETYFVNDLYAFILIDGIPYNSVYPFNGDVHSYFIEMENYLKSNTAEDIKGIEVNYSGKYTEKYVRYYRTNLLTNAFIEITTHSGNGPVRDNTPGVYLYKPLPVSYPKQFYKPKYVVNDTTKHFPDLRSTIDWEPNVITDNNGEATVSFYSADKPSTYTITIEGTDGNGNLGYKRQKLTISTKGNKAK